MIVYRLSASRRSNDLSGQGAKECGGRWNSRGVALLYTCSSRALCVTEIAVRTGLNNIPSDYSLTTIQFPDSIAMQEINLKELDSQWNSFPHPASTQTLGDNFVREGKALVLKVPSATVQGDFNYLINPAHKEFRKVKISSVEPFNFDQRLFRE